MSSSINETDAFVGLVERAYSELQSETQNDFFLHLESNE